MQRIGLLAYGSLRWHPKELADVLDLKGATDVETPFPIEFARTSTARRDGCPTLVPVESGGARVAAKLIPFRAGISVPEAQTRVWRRELLQTHGTYDGERNHGPNKVYVEPVEQHYDGFDLVLAVRIGPNIDRVDPGRLADLAIQSARRPAGERREDGISYLVEAKNQDITTPLLPEYEKAILRRLAVASLEEAWEVARSNPIHEAPS
jgi:hypothetical protein